MYRKQKLQQIFKLLHHTSFTVVFFLFSHALSRSRVGRLTQGLVYNLTRGHSMINVCPQVGATGATGGGASEGEGRKEEVHH